MAEHNRPQKPTGTLQERIDRLRKEFPSYHFSVLPVTDKNFTFEQSIEEGVDAAEQLEAFIKNGYSDEGLWFSYNIPNRHLGKY